MRCGDGFDHVPVSFFAARLATLRGNKFERTGNELQILREQHIVLQMAVGPGKAASKGSGEVPAHKVGANHGANEVFLLCCVAHICHRPFPTAKCSIAGDIIFVKGGCAKLEL